jgi:hypothetical protein
MDSNFQYASTVRWHRATDLPPPTVNRRSAGRPPPMARPRSEAQRGSVRPAAAMRSTDREMRCSAAVQAARYRAARRAAMRAAAVKCRTAAVDGGYAMVAVWLITLTSGGSVKTVAGAAAFITGQTTTRAGAGHRLPYRLMPRGGLSIDDFGAGAADGVA